MIQPIIQAPDERLLKPSLPVRLRVDTIRHLVGDLIDTRIKHDAAGLSAVQIGVHLRVVAVSPNLCGGYSILINPEIVWRSQETFDAVEGCMSIGWGKPRFKVRRCVGVMVQFLDRKGEGVRVGAEKLAAQLIQHEVDHLDGKLIAAEQAA